MSPKTKPAEKLTDSQADEAFGGPARRTNNGARYPWDVWFDGAPYMLSLVDHFPTVKTLRVAHVMIRRAASARGVKVRCRRYESLGKIAVQKVQDAPHKNVEVKGKRIRRILRDTSSPIERGKQQPRHKAG